MRLPANWPELTLALTLAFIASYVIAEFISRVAQSALRAIIADPEVEAMLVDRPRRIVKLAIFLVVASAIVFPAMRLAGYRSRFARDPEQIARWLLESGLWIAVIAVAAYIVVRMGTAGAQRFEREMSHGSGLDIIERTKRAQTLSRLIRKSLTIVVSVIAALMVLRVLNIDITPVLTGAGIAGLAIGFGAQTLVRDVISGFFLILEDQVRVGDVAVVNGQGGLVEEVNLRTMVLRDEEGAVHVFPNGEVKTLANKSKDFSFYIVTVSIPNEEDPDRVTQAIRDASASLMQDSDFKPHILEPIDVYGIDAWEPGQVTIKARIKTVPLKQWFVGRELRRRIMRTFKERGVKVPVPRMELKVDREDSGA